jgi:acetolactate synthase-1/2/3 large subunit
VITGESTSFGERADVRVEQQWLSTLTDVGGPAALALPWTKWSLRLTDPSLLEATLRHAARVATVPPCGPAHLALPMEALLAPCTGAPAVRPAPAPGGLPPYQAAAGAIEAAAQRLAVARQPVIVTQAAGRRPESVDLLVRLAEALGAPVVQSQAVGCLNFPRGHSLHMGYELDPWLPEADVLLLVACEAPLHPASRLAGPGAPAVIAAAEEYGGELMPVDRGPADVALLGPLPDTLGRLLAAVRQAGARQPAFAAEVERRRRRWAEEHGALLRRWEEESRAEAADVLDGAQTASILAETLPADALIVEETTVHKGFMLRFLNRDHPGTYHARITGGLGVSLGVALGLKHASPDAAVVFIAGDGAFHYSPVLAGLGVQQELGLPLLTVVMANGAYASMARSHRRAYPEGWAARAGRFAGTDIAPVPDYGALAACYGGWGARATDAAGLRDAVAAALERVRAGQACIVDVRCV